MGRYRVGGGGGGRTFHGSEKTAQAKAVTTAAKPSAVVKGDDRKGTTPAPAPKPVVAPPVDTDQ